MVMAKRHFLMLAHEYKPAKHGIGGWLMSEKMDGQRAFWDGGVSRGILKSDVPWANTGKDERYNTPPIATGLWSRYGNVIHAPECVLDNLPAIPLDGELWGGRRMPRQELRKIISTREPDEFQWSHNVRFNVFDSPMFSAIFEPGYINESNMKVRINAGAMMWADVRSRDMGLPPLGNVEVPFMSMGHYLRRKCVACGFINVVEQEVLPFTTTEAREVVNRKLEEVSDAGGEGLILRSPYSVWLPERSHSMVKVKKLDDAEGTVVGYTTGRETDKGSKLLGLMGALIVRLEGGQLLELSGFTDQERVLSTVASKPNAVGLSMVADTGGARVWAMVHPGVVCPEWIDNPTFPVGTAVTFRYRGKSTDGIPQEARYWRRHEVE
jgi:DNA ligase 1